MARRFSLGFPTRGGSINQRASDAHDSRYMRSEEQRRDAFQANMFEFQRETQAEEEAQASGEHLREKEFDHMVANFKSVFLQALSRRNDLYKEADMHHEDIFWKADAAREALFSQGQQGRADSFRSDQEAWTKSSEWNSTIRRALLFEGRQRAKDICAALNAVLVEQFNQLMKSQEDEFLADERRRDDLVTKQERNANTFMHLLY
ncbi:hypothetical protein H0H87_001597 [Tephrocybe sp. NHM501043]|nr:hypothetical protein H0H87_001597 [Tephrocybe sp. NHM501043]